MESGPTLSNYRQDRTAQTSGDLRLAPVSLCRDLGSHRNHPFHCGGPLALSQPTGSAYSAQPLPTRGWPSVLLALRCRTLLKLGLLLGEPRDRPGVRMSGDVTPNGRGLDHSGPFAQAAILSSENLESPSSPSPGPYPSSFSVPCVGSRPTTLVGCQHHKRSRNISYSACVRTHAERDKPVATRCDGRPRPAGGEGTSRKG